MSDDVRLERLLADVLADAAPIRAPDHLVPDIVAAASRARRRPRWLALATERPMRLRAAVVVGSPTVRFAYLLLLALLLALSAVATLVAGGIIPRPTDLAVTIPRPTPSPVATLPDCMTDQVTLLPASSAPPISPDDEHTSLVSPDTAFGVYSGLYTGRLWVAGGGRTEPFNFATIRDGQGIEILDISPDGTRTLVQVLESSRSPDCGDLYEFAVDGSGSRRLTFFSTGSVVTGAAYSPDGRSVAYGIYVHEGMSQLIVKPDVGDVMSFPCNLSLGHQPAKLAWSPGGNHVATSCGNALAVFDVIGTSTPVIGLRGEDIVAVHWQDATTLLVASGRAVNPGGLMIRALDPTAAEPVTLIADVDDADITWFSTSPAGFSGDGKWLYATGGPRAPTVGVDEVGYLISTSDGGTTQVLDQGQDFFGWTDDYGAILFLDHAPEGGGAGPRDLVTLEANAGRVEVVGTWTTVCYCQGLWRAAGSTP
jgi:dipeptidyl aminopeptidase/acylaminoacyl peptidase